MTIKGKRAAALRRMDHEEATSYDTGGWVDESFPADDVHKALAGIAKTVDLGAFDGFFGPRLGRYRATLAWQQEQPSTGKELELLREACEAIEQVRVRLKHLPPAAHARIEGITWKRRHEFFGTFQKRLDVDLEEARNLLWLAEREVEADGGRVGKKPATLRDWLLHDVASWVQRAGIRKEQAAGVAANVLRVVDVDAPSDPRKARAIVREVECLKIEAN